MCSKKTNGSHAAARSLPKSRLLPVAASKCVARVRQRYGLGRKQFARITGFSERAIGSWERGSRSRDCDVCANSITCAVIERGETGLIWRFIYFLESGMPV